MLKYMDVCVKYTVCIYKTVVAEDNEDDGEYGYDTQNERVSTEVCKIVDPIILGIKEKLPENYGFEWECESEISE